MLDISALSDIVSPKGLAQSSRMRNMRVLFDGPPPSGTIKITSEVVPCGGSTAAAWRPRRLAGDHGVTPCQNASPLSQGAAPLHHERTVSRFGRGSRLAPSPKVDSRKLQV